MKVRVFRDSRSRRANLSTSERKICVAEMNTRPGDFSSEVFMRHLILLLALVPGLLSSVNAEEWRTTSLRPNGAVPDWLVVGPFPNGNVGNNHGNGCIGFFADYLMACGGESLAMPDDGDSVLSSGTKPLLWDYTTSDSSGLLDFLANLGVDDRTPGVAYAFARVNIPSAREAFLNARSDDGVRIWLNGKMVLDQHKGRSIGQEEDHVRIALRAGDNRLLAKVDQGGGDWGLVVGLVSKDGQTMSDATTRVRIVQRREGKIKAFRLQSTPFVRNSPEGPRQILTGFVRSSGLRNAVCQISKSGWTQPFSIPLGNLPAGIQQVTLPVPLVLIDTPARVILESESDQREIPDFILKRPRKWQLFLVQHTHTDIGYTKSQEEMLAEYFRYIDYALDYCDRTDSYPDDAKFRWTCETSWAVREYLMRRPAAQIERLKKRIREGRIEVTGMLLNMSELASENAIAASLQPIREFKKIGIPVVTAMQNDVNGAAWALTDYLGDAGVKYLTMGINQDRSILPFDRPTVFWWESPSGKRIIAYRADIYLKGNDFLPAGTAGAVGERALRDYLVNLEEKKYPFDCIAVQFGGYSTDNSPPSPFTADAVRKWNEAYLWPRLRLATAREFLDEIASHHATVLPVYRAAWPDWWTDGVGSAARETGVARSTHARLQVTEGLFAMAALLGARVRPGLLGEIGSVQDALLFYDEHTYGASESVRYPRSERSMSQWSQKSSFAWDALKRASVVREEALGLLQTFAAKSNIPTVTVYNSCNWPRSGVVEVYIDHELLPAAQTFRILDDTGSPVPAQLVGRRTEGSTWALQVADIPALGWKTFRIEVGSEKPAARVPDTLALRGILENGYYRLRVDERTGAVVSLIDKESGYQLVDSTAPWQLGQCIHEKLQDRENLTRDALTRSTTTGVTLRAGAAGPVWKSIIATGDVEGCVNDSMSNGVRGFTCEVRLYEAEKRLELRYRLRTLPVFSPEAFYVAFPFSCPGGRIVYEAQGGLVTPGVNQIPGSASDWQTIQNFVSVRDGAGQLIFGSDKAPLVQFGDFNIGKWQVVEKVEKPHVYSWVMNNYWYTNFPATQEGDIAWEYYLTSTRDTSNRAATLFGWNSRLPLVGRAAPASASNNLPASAATLALGPDNVILVNARPALDGRGVILCLREVDGKPATVDISLRIPGKKVKSVEEVNVLEEPIDTTVTMDAHPGMLTLTPFSVKFVRVIPT
jgi:alpha-mannosidase